VIQTLPEKSGLILFLSFSTVLYRMPFFKNLPFIRRLFLCQFFECFASEQNNSQNDEECDEYAKSEQ